MARCMRAVPMARASPAAGACPRAIPVLLFAGLSFTRRTHRTGSDGRHIACVLVQAPGHGPMAGDSAGRAEVNSLAVSARLAIAPPPASSSRTLGAAAGDAAEVRPPAKPPKLSANPAPRTHSLHQPPDQSRTRAMPSAPPLHLTPALRPRQAPQATGSRFRRASTPSATHSPSTPPATRTRSCA